MKKLLALGNRYAQESSWVDFALTKFCLFSMGLMTGIKMPAKGKKAAFGTALGVFAATYVVLMAKVVRVALGMKE